MFKLGLIYYDARGVRRDYAETRRWWEKAAEAGNAAGMDGMGVLYHNGEGVRRDRAQARYWYEKAAAAGNENARENLANLDGRRRSTSGSSGSAPDNPRYPMRSPALCANRPAGYPGC